MHWHILLFKKTIITMAFEQGLAFPKVFHRNTILQYIIAKIVFWKEYLGLMMYAKKRFGNHYWNF